MAKIRTLRKCLLFQELSFRDLAVLAPHVREEKAEANTPLAQSGKPTQGLIILKVGRVRLEVLGVQEGIVEIGPGDFFGELAIADGDQTRGVGAVALEACEFLRLDAKEYKTLLRDAPDVAGRVAQGVMTALAERMAAARQVLDELVSHEGGR